MMSYLKVERVVSCLLYRLNMFYFRTSSFFTCILVTSKTSFTGKHSGKYNRKGSFTVTFPKIYFRGFQMYFVIGSQINITVYSRYQSTASIRILPFAVGTYCDALHEYYVHIFSPCSLWLPSFFSTGGTPPM